VCVLGGVCLIKSTLLDMLHDLYEGKLYLFSLNFGIITFLPKC